MHVELEKNGNLQSLSHYILEMRPERDTDATSSIVSWSLTSLFSTNMAISETNRCYEILMIVIYDLLNS